MDPKQREIIAYMRMEEFRWAVERERVLREAVRRRRQTRRLQGRRAVASPELALESAPNREAAAQS